MRIQMGLYPTQLKGMLVSKVAFSLLSNINCLSVEQPIRFWLSSYKDHWEFQIGKKITPILASPIQTPGSGEALFIILSDYQVNERPITTNSIFKLFVIKNSLKD